MKPMRTTKSIAGELMVDLGRLGCSAAVAARWAILGLGMAVGFQLAAQVPEVPAQTNDVVTAEVLARINEMVQSADDPQPEDIPAPDDLDLIAPNGLPQTNGPAQREDRPESSNRVGTPNRSQNDDRRSRGKRSFRSKSSQSRGAGSANDYSRGADRTQSSSSSGTNAGLARLDYSAFKIIVDRNIFDPNRFPRRPGEPGIRQAPRAVDYLTLVGTMSYEKGTFAFFDGSSYEYKKALKLTDVIAGYKVANIAPKGVRLAAGTNELELSVGAQLRREEDGPWLLAGQSRSYAATSASASTNAAATTTTASSDAASGGAAESDIIKRLREKREKE
jgi:hypothetical protein